MKKMTAMILTLAFLTGTVLFFYSRAVAQNTAKYVGVDKCKQCHTKEYNDFKLRKFTKAWNVLQMRGKTNDGECLQCHATGYGQGGFVSDTETPHLKYKQCEACHGPGSLHADNPGDPDALVRMRTYIRDKDVCIKCHVCMKTHKEADF